MKHLIYLSIAVSIIITLSPSGLSFNNFTGTGDALSKSITFNPNTISGGDSIIINYPDTFTGITIVTSPQLGTGSFSNNTAIFTATGSTPYTITHNGNNPIENGQYLIHIAIKDITSAIKATGYAIMNIDNTLTINTTISESLEFTILSGANINFNLDPNTNSGVDISQSTTFNIKSNAGGGFIIQAKIDQPLTGSGYGDTIANLSGGGENTFSYGLNPGSPTNAFDTGSDLATGSSDLTADSISTYTLNSSNKIGEFQDTIYYYINIDFKTARDIYSASITYTATPSF